MFKRWELEELRQLALVALSTVERLQRGIAESGVVLPELAGQPRFSTVETVQFKLEEIVAKIEGLQKEEARLNFIQGS